MLRRVIFAPDSFKGTLSSPEICAAYQRALHSVYPEATGVFLPIADGGEGTVDCFLAACGGERVTLAVSGPFGEKTPSFYGLLNEGKTAVIETAAAAGLPLVGEQKNPELATTYGVGELIRDAVSRGATEVILGLGGSATNDGGTGMAASLGVSFRNREGQEFTPVGKTLIQIESIDTRKAKNLLQDIRITAMCDVTNPLCGEQGAAAVYAPQKGADSDMIRRLDNGLAHLADIAARAGTDLRNVPGTGAAGGMGFGVSVLLEGQLQSGIDVMLDTTGFDRQLDGTDLVLTGEGRVDGQSVQGKAVAGVARRAAGRGVPTVVIAGDIGPGAEALYSLGVAGILSTNRIAAPYDIQRKRAAVDIEATAETLFRLCRFFQRQRR